MLHDTDEPFDWQWFCYGQAFPTSNGLCGGWPTKPAEAMIVEGSDVQERLDRREVPGDARDLRGERKLFQAKGSYLQRRQNGDVFHCYWQGGAGYGDVLDREPSRVLRDVLNRWVSPDFARDIYGVVLAADGTSVDEGATARRREELLQWRKDNATRPRLRLERGAA